MMLVTSLVGAITGTTAAAGAAAGTAATATAAAGASSGVLTALQGVGTVFSALSTIGAARAQAAEAEAAAQQEELRARQEYTAGREASAKLKKELALTIGRQQVAFAAGGVDLGSVSAQEAQKQAISEAERELGFASNDAMRASLSSKVSAANYRLKKRNVLAQGYISALGSIADFGAEAYARG